MVKQKVAKKKKRDSRKGEKRKEPRKSMKKQSAEKKKAFRRGIALKIRTKLPMIRHRCVCDHLALGAFYAP